MTAEPTPGPSTTQEDMSAERVEEAGSWMELMGPDLQLKVGATQRDREKGTNFVDDETLTSICVHTYHRKLTMITRILRHVKWEHVLL